MSTPLDVIVVGAGFSGICAGVLLKRSGLRFAILEKAAAVGGTWRDNTYPGVACDVPSHLYSYSFDLNPDWSRFYASGEEIWTYQQRCVEKHELSPFIRLSHCVSALTFTNGRWRVELADGRTMEAGAVIAAMGGLHEPMVPDIQGHEHFAGPSFHTAAWDHGAALEGKRIALIGTGASAVQCAPELAKVAAQLYVLQRSATWVLPKDNRPYTPDRQQAFRRSPLSMLWHRYKIWRGYEKLGTSVIRDTPLNRELQGIAEHTIRKTVKDPALAEKLIPTYRYGCKRPTLSSEYYPMFNRSNVQLVTEAIQSINEHGLTLADGRLLEADALIFATGFKSFNISSSVRISGRDSRLLSDVWRDQIFSYRTVMAPGFPNFFMLLGPNSGGLTSAIQMIEAQARFAVRAIKRMRRLGLSSIDPTPDAARDWESYLQRSFADTIANVGCQSWWTQDNGHNHAQYPNSSDEFRRKLAGLRWSDFATK